LRFTVEWLLVQSHLVTQRYFDIRASFSFNHSRDATKKFYQAIRKTYRQSPWSQTNAQITTFFFIIFRILACGYGPP